MRDETKQLSLGERKPGQVEPYQVTILENTTLQLARAILLDFPHELPDIILPECSGRVAWLFLQDVLERAAQGRNVEPPRTYSFISASPRQGLWSIGRGIEDDYDMTAEELLSIKTNDPDSAIPTPSQMKYLETVVNGRRTHRQQAEVIQKNRKQNHRTNGVIILDDFFDVGTTTDIIGESLRIDRIPVYALFRFPTRRVYHRLTSFGNELQMWQMAYFSDRNKLLLQGARKEAEGDTYSVLPVVPEGSEEETILHNMHQQIGEIVHVVVGKLEEQGYIKAT